MDNGRRKLKRPISKNPRTFVKHVKENWKTLAYTSNLIK